MLVPYLEAARGERIIAGWNDHLQPGQIVQLGDPSAKLGWRGMPYFTRICAIARALAGDDMVLAYDQMIYKQPGQETEVLWHQDAGYHWQGAASERGLTCWLALVDVTRDQGTMTFPAGQPPARHRAAPLGAAPQSHRRRAGGGGGRKQGGTGGSTGRVTAASTTAAPCTTRGLTAPRGRGPVCPSHFWPRAAARRAASE